MRIKINLSTNSIRNAINQTRELQRKIQNDLPKVFLQMCVDWIVKEANRNLWATTVGDEVKVLIQGSWTIEQPTSNKIILSNNAEIEDGKNLAVFVEFGVGIVGQGRKHKKAEEADYEYNVITPWKDQFGAWAFTLEEGERYMNIESGFYQLHPRKPNRFETKGTPATMFLYKAWKTFETSGVYKTLWEQAKAKVIN